MNIVSQIAGQSSNSQIAHVWIPIPFRSVVDDQLSHQRFAEPLTRLGVVCPENIRTHFIGVGTIIPPLG